MNSSRNTNAWARQAFSTGDQWEVALSGENGSLLVPFTFRADETIFVIEQFWGRAVQASCNSKEFRALLIFRHWIRTVTER